MNSWMRTARVSRMAAIFAVAATLMSFLPLLYAQQDRHKPFYAKKVLYLDSYHAEYEPSMIMQKAVQSILEPEGISMRVLYLDEKRTTEPDKLKKAALEAKSVIDAWRPDIMIAADDAASKYVVMPYYRNVSLPVVFIGVNWDVAQYGLPCSNVTGQIEVELVRELLDELKKYSSGNRVGLISGDTITDRSALQYYENVLGLEFKSTHFANEFSAWKAAYIEMQSKSDLLLFRNNSGIANWNDGEAEAFIMKHTRVPTGTVSTHLHHWVLLSFAKVNKEFGEYASRTALKILSGIPPGNIPVAFNRQAKILLNMQLAKTLGIKFPMELIEQATFVEEMDSP